jgi:hypothetical protein
LLRNRTEIPLQYEVVLLEALVPQHHLLRKIEAILDTDYICECARSSTASEADRPLIPSYS